jgi:hypothetical protein
MDTNARLQRIVVIIYPSVFDDDGIWCIPDLENLPAGISAMSRA